jgi:hypothetical protein
MASDGILRLHTQRGLDVLIIPGAAKIDTTRVHWWRQR